MELIVMALKYLTITFPQKIENDAKIECKVLDHIVI